MHTPRVLETLLRHAHFLCLCINTGVNTFSPGRQLSKIHIVNFYVRRCSTMEYSSMVLQNRCFLKFFKIHRKTSVSVSPFNKVSGLYPATSLKEKTLIQVFSDEFCEIFKTPFHIILPATASVLQKIVLPIN